MMNCKKVMDVKKEYSGKIDTLDLDLIIAHALKKTREFVLAHPEFPVNEEQEKMIKKSVGRRIKHEPLAYILGHKEFYGLDFEVNKNTLVPRPETELLVELATQEILKTKNYQLKTDLIDVGTGSGNIITSIAKKLKGKNINYFAVDISKEALTIAKRNIKRHNLDKKIKVIHSDLLDFFLKEKKSKSEILNSRLIIVANLPYLSQKIYSATDPTVRNFEPRSALLSGKQGLAHYKKLLKQLKKLSASEGYELKAVSYFEISPEQKTPLKDLVKKIFPKARMKFHKDLSNRWRIAEISI